MKDDINRLEGKIEQTRQRLYQQRVKQLERRIEQTEKVIDSLTTRVEALRDMLDGGSGWWSGIIERLIDVYEESIDALSTRLQQDRRSLRELREGGPEEVTGPAIRNMQEQIKRLHEQINDTWAEGARLEECSREGFGDASGSGTSFSVDAAGSVAGEQVSVPGRYHSTAHPAGTGSITDSEAAAGMVLVEGDATVSGGRARPHLQVEQVPGSITFNCGSASETVQVLKTDIEGQVAEEDEDLPGKNMLMLVNDDDDDRSGTLDMEETGLGVEDDDLEPLNLRAWTGGRSDLKARLRITEGSSYVKLWSDREKTTEITSPATWNTDKMPSTVYIEGLESTPSRNSVELELSLVRPDGTEMGGDRLIVQVIGTSLSGTTYWVGSLHSDQLEGRVVRNEVWSEKDVKVQHCRPIPFRGFRMAWGDSYFILPHVMVLDHKLKDNADVTRKWHSSDMGGGRKKLLSLLREKENTAREVQMYAGLNLSGKIFGLQLLQLEIRDRMDPDSDQQYGILSYSSGVKKAVLGVKLRDNTNPYEGREPSWLVTQSTFVKR